MKKEIIAIRVEDKVKKALTKLAEASRREVSDYLRLLIEDAIKNKTKL